jgi:hypothetical protein
MALPARTVQDPAAQLNFETLDKRTISGGVGPPGPAGPAGPTGPAGADGLPHVVQDEGAALAVRNALNYIGAGVAATDDAANGRTNITIPGYTDAQVRALLTALSADTPDKIIWEGPPGTDVIEFWGERVTGTAMQRTIYEQFDAVPTGASYAGDFGSPSSSWAVGTASGVIGNAIYPVTGGGGASRVRVYRTETFTTDLELTMRYVTKRGDAIDSDGNGIYIENPANTGYQFGARLAGGQLVFEPWAGGSQSAAIVVGNYPTARAIGSPYWLRLTRSGNLITISFWTTDPAAAGTPVISGSHTLTSGEGSGIMGAGQPIRPGFQIFASEAYNDEFSVSAPATSTETRDLFCAITAVDGIRVVKRLYGSSGSSFRSDFQLSGAAAGGDLAGTYPNPTLKVGAVDSSKVLDGSLALADLSATGTKDATTFLRGDNTFAVPPAGSGGSGHTIQDEGVSLTARTLLDFQGAGVTATDNSGAGKTVVSIPGGGGSAPARVTSLPGSPVDAQEVYYVADATNGVIWHLRYNAGSASAYKWEFVGGPNLYAEVQTGEGTASATFADLATVGPSITVPLAGDYLVSIGVRINATTAAVYGRMSFAVGGTAAAVNDSAEATSINGTSGLYDYMSAFQTTRKLAVAAAAAIVAKYNAGGATATFQNRRLLVAPIRVG